ncbi:MAG TPA: S1 family peptidase [Allosphingosinicella sp.]|nr:S1 family peptidase [Allosphingosinicella sp.]
MNRFPVVRCFISALALLGTASLAQPTAEAPKAPPKPKAATKSDVPPGASYLASTYGISVADAAERIRLQDEISALVAQVFKDDDPSFAGIWVQQTPVFKIVIGFTDPDDRKLLKYQIDPKIRRYVQLKKMPRPRKAVLAEQDDVNKRIQAAGIKKFTSWIEEETGTLAVRVETAAEADKVRTALAGISPAPRVEVGPIPTPTAAPVGVQLGDYIYGGFNYWQTNQIDPVNPDPYKGCSFAFPATLGTTKGILTAGHCEPGPDGKYWYSVEGHWVQLPSPTIARWAYGTKYDYQFHETTGMDTGSWVYYENYSTEPAYPRGGYFYVTGTVGYYGQTSGMAICKSGWKTGLVCGTIDNGAYTYNGVKGWIHAVRNSGSLIAAPGDSGGAVFSPADSAGNIKAYGIITAGGATSGGASQIVYMPIDYIDDEVAIRVMTNN